MGVDRGRLGGGRRPDAVAVMLLSLVRSSNCSTVAASSILRRRSRRTSATDIWHSASAPWSYCSCCSPLHRCKEWFETEAIPLGHDCLSVVLSFYSWSKLRSGFFASRAIGLTLLRRLINRLSYSSQLLNEGLARLMPDDPQEREHRVGLPRCRTRRGGGTAPDDRSHAGRLGAADDSCMAQRLLAGGAP